MASTEATSTTILRSVQKPVLESAAGKAAQGKAKEKMSISPVLDSDSTRISYLPELAQLFDDDIALAIFLQQIWFWTEWHRKKGDLEDGWLYQSSDQIIESTRITYKQQSRVRATLVWCGVLEERHDRDKHRMYFKINRARLDELNQEHLTKGKVVRLPTKGKEAPDKMSDGTLPNVSSYKEDEIVDEKEMKCNTVESSEKAEVPTSKSEPYFRAFREHWRSATGVGCPKGKMEAEFVEKYAAACAAYGELEVLSMVDEYGVQNAEWIQKFRASPKKFFEDVDEMAEARKITAQRIENSKPIDAWERIRLKNEAEDRERGRK